MAPSVSVLTNTPVPADLPNGLGLRFAGFPQHGPSWLRDHTPDLGPVLDAVDGLGDAWQHEPVLSAGGRLRTLPELAALAAAGLVVVDRPWVPGESLLRRTLDRIGQALAHRRFDVRWRAEAGRPGRVVLASPAGWVLPEGLRHFRPWTFLPYPSAAPMVTRRALCNARHPVCRWVVDRAPELDRRFTGLLDQLRAAFHGPGLDDPDYLDFDGEYGVDEPDDEYEWYGEIASIGARDRADRTLRAVRDVVHRVVRVAPELAPDDEVMRILEQADG